MAGWWNGVARRRGALAALGLSLSLFACGTTPDLTGSPGPVIGADASPGSGQSSSTGTAALPDAGATAASAGPAASPPAVAMDSGAAPMVAPEAGPVPQLEASTPEGSSDAASSDAGASGDDAEGGVSFTLPEPAMPGPYGVVVEENVGKGFENAINSNDMPGDNQYCIDFALSFGQDEAQSREFAKIPDGMNMALYTLFRPEKFEPGKKYPILSWGNGTCALPQGYQHLLRHLASHGFWVIAANSRFTGDGSAQKKGIDVMIALSKDAKHAAFERVDAEKVGLFGHSQGGLSTSAASADTRADTAVILNSGGGGSRIPTYYVTGEQDLAPFLSELSYDLASAPAASINYKMSDHITLITEPMRIFPAVAAWFRYQLLGDAAGKEYFVGTNCKLCNRASEWSYRQKNLR
jgi:hypothetical protein